MGVSRRLRRRLCFAALALLLLLLAAVSATGFDPNPQFRSGIGTRRIMDGVPRRPGSWPPSCVSKCGRCTPCAAVHVPIRPGMSTTLEYYPEAWRCKCGDKLFMP